MGQGEVFRRKDDRSIAEDFMRERSRNFRELREEIERRLATREREEYSSSREFFDAMTEGLASQGDLSVAWLSRAKDYREEQWDQEQTTEYIMRSLSSMKELIGGLNTIMRRRGEFRNVRALQNYIQDKIASDARDNYRRNALDAMCAVLTKMIELP